MCSASPTEVKSELSVEEDIRLSRWETIVIKKLKKYLFLSLNMIYVMASKTRERLCCSQRRLKV